MGRKRRAGFDHRRRQTLGTIPGSLVAAVDAPPTTLHMWVFTPDKVEERPLKNVDDLATYNDLAGVRWVDVAGTGNADEIKRLGEIFGLHPLALEDVVNGHQRPKLEEYSNHLFVVVKMPEPKADTLVFEQLAMFVGPDFLVTIQEIPGDCFDGVRTRLRESIGRIRTMGPDYLAYALVDSVIDSFFPLLEEYSDRLEEMELRVLASNTNAMAADIHALRHDLRVIRRVMWSTRETLNSWGREEHHLVQETTRPFLRDCHDHSVQLLEIVEGCQELASSLRDLHMSALSARMNEIMKVLTMIATLFMPLSFIAGIYGMNFDTEKSSLNMPELKWQFGYLFALGLMLGTVTTFVIYFKRKGWILTPNHGVLPPDDRTP